MRYNLLVADDDEGFVNSIKFTFKEFDIYEAYSIDEARKKLSDDVDIVLLDLVFDETEPDKLQGMEFLPEIREDYPDLPIIIMTNFASVEKSVEAIKLGAKDFFKKSKIDWTEWQNRIINYCYDYRKIKKLQQSVLLHQEDDIIIGDSAEMDYLKLKLRDLAKNTNETSILITGESGTGKNLAVRYYRSHSPRRNKPYIEFSISEKSESILESELFGHTKGAFTGAEENRRGLFEAADGGILFLDEIGDYSLSIQSKILKFLETKAITPVGDTKPKKLDIQLIMATNKNLQTMIEDGSFRDDLYYRIDRIMIKIPPLRERKKDIRELANYYFERYRKQENSKLESIDDEVYSILEDYSWSGNIRELQSVFIKVCADGRLIEDKVLRKEYVLPYLYSRKEDKEQITFENYKTEMARLELRMIDKALRETHGQKAKAAEILGMTADQMRYRIKNYLNKNSKNFYDYNNINKYYLNKNR